jgi:hypothetical protein
LVICEQTLRDLSEKVESAGVAMSIDQSSGLSRIATIDEIHRPYETFLERSGGSGSAAVDFSPLDAYLLRLLVEFCPVPVTVVDVACLATRCCSTFICLRNKNVAKVIASVDTSRSPGETSTAIDLLGAMAEPGKHRTVPEFVVDVSARPWERHSLRIGLHPALSLFLIDPRTVSTSGLIETLQSIFSAAPRSLVLVVTVGRVGECETVTSLSQACHGSSPLKLWLLRDLSGALLESRLALVAPRELSSVPAMILRLEELFATNFDFLQLLHGCSMYAIEQGLSSRWEEEIQKLKSQAEQLRSHTEQLNSQAEQLKSHTEQLKSQCEQLRSHAADSEREHVRLQAQLESFLLEKVESEAYYLNRMSNHEAQIERLQGLLHRECTRPVGKAIALQSGRRMVRFVRRHRALFAPAGSFRERVARRLMRTQRTARGKVG